MDEIINEDVRDEIFKLREKRSAKSPDEWDTLRDLSKKYPKENAKAKEMIKRVNAAKHDKRRRTSKARLARLARLADQKRARGGKESASQPVASSTSRPQSQSSLVTTGTFGDRAYCDGPAPVLDELFPRKPKTKMWR